MAQLKMIFNAETAPLPQAEIPAGFRLRSLAENELELLNGLRLSAGFVSWTPDNLRQLFERTLPEGILLFEDAATGRLAASATAAASKLAGHSGHGSLDWVMTHPDYRGRHLGSAVCALVMRKLYAAGYRTFVLLTDDHRLPAITVYLRLGWHPWLYQEDMGSRWRAIGEKLNLSFDSLGALAPDSVFPSRQE